ncbi:hypothetical protein ABZ342_41705 [Amycolatopsis sp. NPDC005961]|uniref:hypothetical protein n=1 Tax=Amycolatopsis sp. NPDC005961 TaxID=3156720 RepID=UPI00340F2A3A
MRKRFRARQAESDGQVRGGLPVFSGLSGNVRVFTNVNYKSTSDLFTANGQQSDLYQAKFLDESIKFVS